MADLLSSIAGPVVSGGLNLLGGLFQQQGQQSSIQQQEAFQQQMSSSAYSRAVDDMKHAGLNPALMYGSGGPESSPAGASVTPPNVLGGVAGAVQDTISTNRQQDLQEADLALKHLEALTNSAKLPMYKAEGDLVNSLVPAMHELESFLQTSAGGLGQLGKAVNQGVNSASNWLGDVGSDISKWWNSPSTPRASKHGASMGW